jgi:hypothetical protein
MPLSTSFSFADLMNEVRDLHSSFTEDAQPLPIVLRSLARQERMAIAAAAKKLATWDMETEVFDAPSDGGFDPATPLELSVPFRYFLQGEVFTRAPGPQFAPIPLNISTYGQRLDPNPTWTVTPVPPNLLRLQPRVWVEIVRIQVDYAPGLPDVRGVDDTFQLHDTAHDALLYGCAIDLAARDVPAPPPPSAQTRTTWADQFQAGVAAFLDQLEGDGMPRVMYIRDVT